MANEKFSHPAVESVRVPVLIAGGGPVGLALAIELGLRGIACLLVEKRDGSLPVPKMSQVSSRNMEFCRRWGIAEQVKTAVWSVNHSFDFVYLTSLTGRELARMKVPSYAERGDLGFTPEGSCHCPQNYFDPILAERARSLPPVTLRYNVGVESFSQDDEGVHVRLTDSLTGRSESVTARHLVGCDGPSGMVREAMGIELGGLGVVANSVNIFFRSPALATLHDKGWARFYRAIDEKGCWSELIPIDGRELWRLTVFDDPSPRPDAAAALRKLMGHDFAFEPISVIRWERRDYVADRYGHGRVFIAGDAAHQCSPTGGLGMHTGVEEAVNLGWKLAAMLEGWGGVQLLASYEAERRPIALRNVAFATRAYRNISGIVGGDALDESTPEGDRQREQFAARNVELRRFSVGEHVKTLYGYENSPVCVSDGSASLPEEPAVSDQSARPGSRAPHAWLADGRSTLDLFGRGFVLLRLGDAAPDASALVGAAKSRGVPLAVVTLPDPTVARLYERRLVLVRPDGHVAWRGDDLAGDPFAVVDRVRGAL